jgi:hypothetical protein
VELRVDVTVRRLVAVAEGDGVVAVVVTTGVGSADGTHQLNPSKVKQSGIMIVGSQ